MKTLIGSMNSFQKLNQFSQGKSTLDAEPYDVESYFGKIQVFLLLSYIDPFGIKTGSGTMKNICGMKYFFQKLSKFSQGNNVLEASASTQMVFILDLHVLVQLS
jgi:hypothetical protein